MIKVLCNSMKYTKMFHRKSCSFLPGAFLWNLLLLAWLFLGQWRRKIIYHGFYTFRIIMILNFLVALNSFLPLSKLALWMTLLVRKALAFYKNICWYASSEFDDSKTRVEKYLCGYQRNQLNLLLRAQTLLRCAKIKRPNFCSNTFKST